MKTSYSSFGRHLPSRDMYRRSTSRFLSPTPLTERNAVCSPTLVANACSLNRFFRSSEVRVVDTPDMSSKAKWSEHVRGSFPPVARIPSGSLAGNTVLKVSLGVSKVPARI